MAYNRMKLPMFDDYWIDFRPGTVRRWFKPELHGMAPGGPYSSMFYDPLRKKYRVYYECLRDWGKDGPRNLKLVESDDLRTFTPVLADDGTDVIYDGVTGLHGCSVMYDPYDPDPARRYKLCGMFDMERKETAEGRKTNWIGVEIALSADGVHWERHTEMLANPQTSDALNKLIYNPVTEEYNLFHRSAYVDRRISVRSSKDLIHWSEPHIILQPSANYNDGFTGMQQYSMTGKYMDGLFYGLVWRFNTCLYQVDFSRMFGYMEPELVYSYDGSEYLYTTGEPIMDRPLPPAPGCVGLAPDDICESADGQYYYIDCFGYVFIHGTAATNKAYKERLIQKGIDAGNPIYRIRKDGFCGIESVNAGGRVITKALCLIKDDLSFNIRANCGGVRFGIMKRNGEYYEGFSPDDCVPFELDDSVDVRPQWKEHKLEELLGKQIRIEVELNTAILHCITATAQPFIVQKQRSFAQPEGIPEA